jgi:hypothetical protein
MMIPNLLLIAGTGNKSGKTTFACRVIEQFRDSGITGIKITPHFHETTPGLDLLISGEGYSIYEERDAGTDKDTSRMLRSGAGHVYFAKVTDRDLTGAFSDIMKNVPEGAPVVCESPALRQFVEPGLFIIMTSDNNHNNKNIKRLQDLPHVLIRLENLVKFERLPISFKEGNWYFDKI